MLGITRKKVLKVSLLDISPHNKAILEFFFAGAGSRLFKTSAESDADIFIVDFDYPNAQKNWEKTNEKSNKPTLALAFHKTEAANTIWLAKPLTTQALTDAASKIQTLLDQSKTKETTSSTPKTEESDTINTASNLSLLKSLAKKKAPLSKQTIGSHKQTAIKRPAVKATLATPLVGSVQKDEKPSQKEKVAPQQAKTEPKQPTISLEDKKKRWSKLCGDAEDIRNINNWKSETALYTPENYLISSLQDALRLAIQSQQMVKIEINNIIFYFMPELNQAYSNIAIDSDKFETLCKTPIKKNNVIIHIMNTKEVELAHNTIAENPKNIIDLEGFIWTAMLLTSSGKLHRNVDLRKRIMLKHWPNFTRIETFPHVIRISALWSNDAFNMLEVAHNLQIPQRYVFAFYNAACVLGLMEHDAGKLKAKTKQPKKENKSRGLFSRLLKRLTG